MILINVLPPEYRRSDSAVNPVYLVGFVWMLLIAAIVYLAYHVHFERIPVLIAEKEELESKKLKKTNEATKVDNDKKRLVSAKKRMQDLGDLLNKKVLHAKDIDDFVNMMASKKWKENGFSVSILDLSITPAKAGNSKRGKSKKNTKALLMPYDWTFKCKILGDGQDNLAGTYIDSFFEGLVESTTKNNKTESSFWIKHRFEGKPEFSYKGDKPVVNEELQKTSVSLPLVWKQVIPLGDNIINQGVK